MEILFVAGFSPIVPSPIVGRTFYQEALGLPLKTVEGDYLAVDGFEGSKHLGVWPTPRSRVSGLASGPMTYRSPRPASSSKFLMFRQRLGNSRPAGMT